MKFIDEKGEASDKKYDDIKKNKTLIVIIVNVAIIIVGLILTVDIFASFNQFQKYLINYKDIDYIHNIPIIDDENNNYKIINSYTEFEKIMSKISEISTEDTEIVQEIKEEINEEFFKTKSIIIQDSNKENFITSYDLEKVYFKKDILKMDLSARETKFNNGNINGTLTIISLRNDKEIKKVETKYVFENTYLVKQIFSNLILFMIILLFFATIFRQNKKSFIYFATLILYITIKFLIEIVLIL